MYFTDFWPNVLGFSLSIVLALFGFTLLLLCCIWLAMQVGDWLDRRKRRLLRKEHVRAAQEYLQRRSFDV